MCKQILLPTSVKSEMMKTFKTGHKALERALKFQINSKSARKLRAAALQRGGRIYNDAGYENGFIPDCDIQFDHSAGIMTQTLSDGVQLVAHQRTGTVKIFNGDQEIAKFTNMTTADWSRLLYGLEMMYNNLNS